MLTDISHRLFVFDCDGTLVDSQHNIVAAMAAAWARHDLPAPQAADVRRIVGLSLEIAIARLLPDADERDAPRAGRRLSRDRAWPAHGECARHGGRTLVPRHPRADRGAGRAGDLPRRRHRQESARAGAHAAHARIARPVPHPADRRSVPQQARPGDGAAGDGRDRRRGRRSTVVIGDTSFDMEMARSAGATAIGVAWGYHETAELTHAGAHAVIRHPPTCWWNCGGWRRQRRMIRGRRRFGA